MWDELDLVRIFTKKRGAHPDLDDPVCMRRGATVEVRPFLFLFALPLYILLFLSICIDLMNLRRTYVTASTAA